MIQVNGKIRDKIDLDADLSKEELEKLALNNEKIKKLLDGKNLKRLLSFLGK